MVEGGRDKVFVPFMGRVYKSILGEAAGNKISSVVESTSTTETPIKKETVSEIIQKYESLSSSFIYKPEGERYLFFSTYSIEFTYSK